LVVLAFWLVPLAWFANGLGAVPLLVQVMSLGVVLQANCAAAGEFASSAPEDRRAALQNGSARHIKYV